MSKIRSIVSLLIIFALSISVAEAGVVYASMASSELEGQNRFEEEEEEESIHSLEHNDVSHYSVDGGDPNADYITPSEAEIILHKTFNSGKKSHNITEKHLLSVELFLLFCCLKLDI